MYLIAGLGNIGSEYRNNRHNTGFMAVDEIAERNDIDITRTRFNADYGKGTIAGEKVILIKPRTYMNSSGDAVSAFRDFFKVENENVIVIYDDIELPLGKLRIRKAGGPGTHNGMKSVIEKLGTDSFPRFRLGVGSPEHGDLINYVLSDFTEDDMKEMKPLIEKTAKAVYTMIDRDIDMAMNRYNG